MYRGEDYPDMSEYVVHFTRGQTDELGPGHTPYDNVVNGIIYNKHIKPSSKPFGAAARLGWLGDIRRAVCFSEVPLPYVGRLASRRSQYGIGFKQSFVADRMGARVWYLDVDSEHDRAWLGLQASKERERDPEDTFWGLATCVDRVGRHGRSRYEFEWEREWRIPGPGGLRFDLPDVAFVFLPQRDHAAAKAFFDDFFYSHQHPTFECPYVDPLWPPDRIAAALKP